MVGPWSSSSSSASSNGLATRSADPSHDGKSENLAGLQGTADRWWRRAVSDDDHDDDHDDGARRGWMGALIIRWPPARGGSRG